MTKQRVLLFLAFPLLLLVSADEISRDVSSRFVNQAPPLAHVHLIPTSPEEEEVFCLDFFAENTFAPSSSPSFAQTTLTPTFTPSFTPTFDTFTPTFSPTVNPTSNPSVTPSFAPAFFYYEGPYYGPYYDGPAANRNLQKDEPELPDVCRVEFFLEFEQSVNWTDVGIFDTDFFLCTEIFDFFQLGRSGLVDINDILADQICEFCIEGDVEDTPFAVLVIPEIRPRDVFEPYYFEYYYEEEFDLPFIPTAEIRSLQEAFNFELDKFMKVKNQTGEAIEVVRVDELFMNVGFLHNFTRLAVEFNTDIHFVQQDIRTTNAFTTDCSALIQNTGIENNTCTFSIVDGKFLVVDVEPDLLDLGDNILFFKAETPIYAQADRFGLKPPVFNDVFFQQQPLLVNIQQDSLSSFFLQFSEAMVTIDIERVICADIIDFARINGEYYEGYYEEYYQPRRALQEDPLEFIIPYFSERLDYVCALTWSSNTTAQLDFVENVPVIFEPLLPFFAQDGPIARANGFGVPFSPGLVFPPEVFELNATAEAQFQSELSLCDTEILIQVQITTDAPVLVNVVVETESIIIIADGDIPIEAPEDFCRVVGTLVRCDITKLGVANFTSVQYVFALDIEAVGLPSDTTTNFDIASLSGIFISQNIGEVRIPIDIPGINFAIFEDEGNEQIPVRGLQTIENGQVTVKRGITSKFTAVVGNIFGCVSVDISQLLLLWTVTDLQSRQDVLTRTGKLLTIPGDALEANVPHQIRFTASLLSENIETTVFFNINVDPADIVLVPEFGNEQTVSDQAETLTLSALRSCNPNVLDGVACQSGIGFIDNQALDDTEDEDLADLTGLGELDLIWRCSNCGEDEDEVFNGTDRTQPVVKIPLSNLVDLNITELEFTFTATDPLAIQEEKEIAVQVTVLETPENCVFPDVSILPVDARVNANSALALQGSINPVEPSKFQWVESSTSNFLVFDPEDPALKRLDLFIPANTLSDGETYTFRLIVTPDCADEGVTVPSAVTSFTVNNRPFGGFLDVDPLEGTALTDFVLTTSGWNDPEVDTPLQFAFEVIYLPVDAELPDEFDPQQTIPLSQFSQQATLTTNLQIPPEGTRIVLIAVARDALGAVSRRVLANAFDGVIVNNPFVNDGQVDANVLNVDVINDLIQNLQDTGDASLIPNLCSAITSALNELSAEDLLVVEQEIGLDVLADVRTQCFAAVAGVVDLVDGNGEVDTDVVNLVASSLSTITEQFDQLDDEVLEQIDQVAATLVQNMQDQVAAIARGEFDPAVASIIPESFKQNILDTVSNILDASDAVFGLNSNVSTSAFSRRRLQALDPCVVLGGARSNVIDLTNLETSVVTNGAPSINAEANSVSFTAQRESINDVGVLSNLLVIPDAVGGNNEIELPAALAAQLRNVSGQDVDLNILAAKWNVLIRCEERPVEEVLCLEEYVYDGPRRGSEGNVVSLDFFPFDGSGDNITVEDIAEPIVIFLDLPDDIENDLELLAIRDACDKELEDKNKDGNGVRELESVIAFDDIQCGFFDEVNGDFITEFCDFAGIEERNGVNKVRCECFHATDYAAWNAFRYDVRATLVPQVVLSELAQLILLVICPIVLVLFAILLLWAYYRDRKDAQNILKGALARIKLMRIIKMRQKRLFFDRIRVAQVETIMKVHDLKIADDSSRRREGVSRSSYFCRQFYLAVKYEHSLFGLSRYDPNFSRVQRVWIFIAVVISNFGAAGLLFELRSNVYEISILVTVAVSFGAAFLVSIPVKMVARALFKTTENKRNSKEDQVNSMYKIITRLETADGTETEHDKNLVEAIHDYHVAESTLKRRGFKGSTLRRTKTLVAVAETEHVAEVVEGSEEDDILQEAQIVETFIAAKYSLSEASKSARSAWKEAKAEGLASGKFYSSWGKLKSLRNTSSTLLKTATLFSGEASKVARPRESRLPYCIVVFDYIILTLIVMFYAYYTFQFVATRATRAEEGFDGNLDPAFDPITEEEYIIQWAIGAAGGILISYLIAEPVIALMRYVLIPMCVSKCNKEPEEPEEVDLSKVDLEHFDEKKAKKNIRDSYAHYAFDLVGDLMENLF